MAHEEIRIRSSVGMFQSRSLWRWSRARWAEIFNSWRAWQQREVALRVGAVKIQAAFMRREVQAAVLFWQVSTQYSNVIECRVSQARIRSFFIHIRSAWARWAGGVRRACVRARKARKGVAGRMARACVLDFDTWRECVS